MTHNHLSRVLGSWRCASFLCSRFLMSHFPGFVPSSLIAAISQCQTGNGTFDQDHCKKNYKCSANYISDIFGFWVSWVLEIRRMWPQPPPAGCPPRPPRTLLVYQLSLSEEGALIRGSPQRSTVAPSDGSTYLIDIPRASNRSLPSFFCFQMISPRFSVQLVH